MFKTLSMQFARLQDMYPDDLALEEKRAGEREALNHQHQLLHEIVQGWDLFSDIIDDSRKLLVLYFVLLSKGRLANKREEQGLWRGLL